MKGVLFLRT